MRYFALLALTSVILTSTLSYAKTGISTLAANDEDENHQYIYKCEGKAAGYCQTKFGSDYCCAKYGATSSDSSKDTFLCTNVAQIKSNNGDSIPDSYNKDVTFSVVCTSALANIARVGAIVAMSVAAGLLM